MGQPLIYGGRLQTQDAALEQLPDVYDHPHVRLIDTLMAAMLLVLFGPVMVLCATAIRLGSRGPIFYRQERIGLHGKPFMLIKFRSMVVDAEATTGAVLSWSGDPRVTPLGRFLRASHLDELPQLINVLRGDMAMIGPRPERPDFVKVFNQRIPFYALRSRARPGITGLAQIYLPYDAAPEAKLTYDLEYLRRRSWRLDAIVVWQTALKMLGVRYRHHPARSEGALPA
jgi:lipopolysaccharide/colanic/teichoic acid biosynthesis glycosyltransferase